MLVGVLSEVDLIEVVVQDSYYNENVGIVADFMQSEVEWVEPDMDIFTWAKRFTKRHRRRYPVLENGQLVGQISRRDVLRAAMDLSPTLVIQDLGMKVVRSVSPNHLIPFTTQS